MARKQTKKPSRSPKPRKTRFQFASLTSRSRGVRLRAGDEHDDVRVLQAILSEMGYLGRDRVPGTMCGCTCNALSHFQKCYGLTVRGEADTDTLELLQMPRCGVPDADPTAVGTSSGAAPFVLSNCRYQTNDLTYAFVNSTADLTVDRQQEIIREAFAAWAAVTPLRFTEVSPRDSPTFPISWERRAHGDGFPFDEGGFNGNTLAHAFFPPPCGGRFAGALHFDDFEVFTDQAASGAVRLLNVAIHEIGHNLGLQHSNTRDAIMFAFYDDDVDSLRQDDIDGIQAIYGARATGPAPIRGRLRRTGDSDLHRVSVPPGTVTVTLQGAPGADFDLYLRTGLPPTRRIFDARGFSATPNEQLRLNVTGGDLFILVDSFRGSGNYEVTVEFN